MRCGNCSPVAGKQNRLETRMASPRRMYLHLLVGLIVSAAAIYLSVRKVDFTALWAFLHSANYFFLVPAVGVQFLCFFLKGIGWRYLLFPAKEGIRVISTTSVLIIGLMVNDLFPAKMGELARAYLMGEREKLPKSLCLSTIIVEHLLDILVLLIFLLILLPLVSLPPWLQTSGTLVGFLALGMIGVLFFVMRREEKFLKWISRLLIHLPDRLREKVQAILNNIFQGLRVVTGRYILYAFAALVGMWSMVFLLAYLIMAAFGLFLPVHAPIMVIIFAAFGKIIPSSPGGIGTLHYLIIVVLMAFGVSKELALGFAIIFHGIGFLVEVSSGIAVLLAWNLSLGRIVHRVEESP